MRTEYRFVEKGDDGEHGNANVLGVVAAPQSFLFGGF